MGPTRGRPRRPISDAERLEDRRAKVRQNVRAFRKRQREHCDPKPVCAKEVHSENVFDSQEAFRVPIKRCPYKSTAQADTAFQSAAVGHVLLSPEPQSALEARLRLELQTPTLFASPSAAAQYKIALLASLYNKYMPAHDAQSQMSPDMVPRGAIPLLCSTWITSPCSVGGEENLSALADATLAMCLMIVGSDAGNPSISQNGLQIYQRALFKLRRDLRTVTVGHGQDMIEKRQLHLSSFACAQIELMANKSYAGLEQHMKGIGLLIQCCGHGELVSGIGQDLVYEFRAMEIVFCLANRRASFLSEPEWIDVAWKSSNPQASSHMQRLLDIIYAIPPVMETFDRDRKAPSPHVLRLQLDRLKKTSLRMDEWALSLRHLYGPRLQTRRYPQIPAGIQDMAVFPNSVTFVNFSVASALGYFFAAKAYLLDLKMDIEEELRKKLSGNQNSAERSKLSPSHTAAESLFYARSICQSMEYFFEDDKKLASRVNALFPFHAAIRMFSKANERSLLTCFEDGSVDFELEWCRSMAARFERCGLPLRDGALPSSFERGYGTKSVPTATAF